MDCDIEAMHDRAMKAEHALELAGSSMSAILFYAMMEHDEYLEALASPALKAINHRRAKMIDGQSSNIGPDREG